VAGPGLLADTIVALGRWADEQVGDERQHHLIQALRP